MELSESNKIPGMIEPDEQELLYNLSKDVELEHGEIIVEFGTFFGRSTNCLAQGLTKNSSFHSSNQIWAYDSFSCVNNGRFAKLVTGYAKAGGVADLIRTDESRLDFRDVFKHYLKSHIQSGLIKPIYAELTDSFPPEKPITLMHVDSPKFYDELKVILFRFFPQLKTGSKVVFQDYFYHWSATLIAAVQAIKNSGLFAFKGSVATSLIVELTKSPTMKDIMEVDLVMNQKKQIPILIDQAIAECSKYTIDRPQQFLPRLYLAKFQYLWEVGKTDEAARSIADFFDSGGKLNQAVVNDYMEMIENGFSIRSAYELDYQF